MLRFVKGIYSEDMDWCARLAIAANNISYLDAYAYAYRQRAGSISKSISEKNIIDIEENIKRCLEYKYEYKNGFKESYFNLISQNLSTYCIILSTWKEKQSYNSRHLAFIEEYKWLFKWSTRLREKLIYIAISIVGCSKCIILLRKADEWKKIIQNQ